MPRQYEMFRLDNEPRFFLQFTHRRLAQTFSRAHFTAETVPFVDAETATFLSQKNRPVIAPYKDQRCRFHRLRLPVCCVRNAATDLSSAMPFNNVRSEFSICRTAILRARVALCSAMASTKSRCSCQVSCSRPG